MSTAQLDIQRAIRAACVIEATARKPGNVHPQASFTDMTYRDFLISADIVAPLLANAPQWGVGRTIRQAIRTTCEQVGCNTNLGIVLLLAPLAAVPPEVSLDEGIADVLDRLDRTDARLVYEAIRMANPGGMGDVETDDVALHPSGTLLDVMKLAADRDQIAAQYASRFSQVLRCGLPYLAKRECGPDDWEEAVIGLQLQFMSEQPDSLIARKCGAAVAEESMFRAQAVLRAGWPHERDGQRHLSQFDAWLREDGHRRNPGTTADLVTCSLFAAMRDGYISTPARELIDQTIQQNSQHDWIVPQPTKQRTL